MFNLCSLTDSVDSLLMVLKSEHTSEIILTLKEHMKGIPKLLKLIPHPISNKVGLEGRETKEITNHRVANQAREF